MKAKALTVALIVVLILALALPVHAGRGDPETARQGEQSGQALQAGPNGPNYGCPGHECPAQVSESESESATVHAVFLPYIGK